LSRQPLRPSLESSRVVIDALHGLRGDYTAPAQRRKKHLLARASRARMSRADDLLAFHDELLFLAAFPDSATISDMAGQCLTGMHRRVGALSASGHQRLADTGIEGSVATHTFMYGVVQWLVRHGEEVRPAWRNKRDAERLEPLLRLTMLAAEADAFDSGEFSTQEWIELASRRVQGGPLHWLIGADGAPPASRELYDNAELPVSWSLGASPRSVTRNRAPDARIVFRSGFRPVPADPLDWLRRPLVGVRRVTGETATRWIDASIAALVARCREVVPTIYANPDEVYVADLGEGARLCVIGAQLADRLALEANYGYVMFSNGVPIGYGGVTPLADQANTGANVFEAFRKSEAAYLFGQSLRAFRALFGVSRFVVNPYQFGAGNDEALQSGAYWFYDRLGFRPVDATIRALADRERTRRIADPRFRSSQPTLRRLARSDVVLELDPTSAVPFFDEGHLVHLGAHVAASLAEIPSNARDAYLQELALTCAAKLGGIQRAPGAAETRGIRLLGPVIALLEREILGWPADDQRSLWALVRAKGAKQEREFTRLSRRHARFWHALHVSLASSARR
jgi:hypothetical protein